MSDDLPQPAEQFIVVDLGATQTFSGVHLTPRQSWTSGIITDYEIRVSNDPADFSAMPVSEGTLWNPDKRTVRRIEFATPANGRFVRVSNTGHEGGGSTLYAAIGEFALADEAPAPVGRRWIHLPNSVMDLLDLQSVELEIKVNSATPVALAGSSWCGCTETRAARCSANRTVFSARFARAGCLRLQSDHRAPPPQRQV